MSSMTAGKRAAVERNIFPLSRLAVEPWDEFRWHPSAAKCDTDEKHSSQALAIDVFGYLKLMDQTGRNCVLNSLARRLGLPDGNDWDVVLEWTDELNRMQEPRQSQIDAVARSAGSLVFFESKFNEPDGGPCSQTKPLRSRKHKGKVQCNGSYLLQTNPVNGRRSRCALSGKNILYWEVIPAVFEYSSSADYDRCPFAGPWYQWMRNMTVAYQVAKYEEKKAGFIVVYVDDRRLRFARKVARGEWSAFSARVRQKAIPVKAISYQQFLRDGLRALPRDSGVATDWLSLEIWVKAKIEAALAGKR